VIEEQVEIEFIAAHLKTVLAADEGEAHPESQKELPEMLQEPAFQISFVTIRAKHQEIEVVGIFRNLAGQVRLRWRQNLIDVRYRPALPPV